MTEVNTDIYYNGQTLLSKNALINLVTGERGNGKTYYFKRWCVKDFKRNGNQFVWIRRYTTELDDIELFFSDLLSEFPDDEFKVKGGKFYINGEIAGFYLSLSKAVTKKSVPFPLVNKIIFDEFIIEKSNYHYLPNEVKAFLDVVETIARTRDVRCFLLANSITQANPYFTYFNITPNPNSRFTRVGDVLLERTESLAYRYYKKNTRFGKLIDNTSYGRYAIDNEFVNDNFEFIEKRTEFAKNIFNLVIMDKTIGLWADYQAGKLFASFKYDPAMPVLCLTTEDMKPNYMILNSRSNNMKILKDSISFGYLYYESFKVKTYMMEVLKLLNIR